MGGFAKNSLSAIEKSGIWLLGGDASHWAMWDLRLIWGAHASWGKKGLRFLRENGRLLVVLEQNITIFEKVFAEAWLIVRKEKQRYKILKWYLNDVQEASMHKWQGAESLFIFHHSNSEQK